LNRAVRQCKRELRTAECLRCVALEPAKSIVVNDRGTDLRVEVSAARQRAEDLEDVGLVLLTAAPGEEHLCVIAERGLEPGLSGDPIVAHRLVELALTLTDRPEPEARVRPPAASNVLVERAPAMSPCASAIIARSNSTCSCWGSICR
jgi:hypothetical protein